MTTRIDLYTLFERIWHWLQAIAIAVLLLTGLEIHAPSLHLIGFGHATVVHEAVALFTVANAFLALFYHLATGAIRQFVPAQTDFFSLAIAQGRYYIGGIFRGDPHPFEQRPGHKLNVLQQATYLIILNVLLPLQVVTGVLMWKAHAWAPLLDSLGGLGTLAAVHTFCAWLFAAFIVMHVYLTTTGKTPLALIKAMVVGWEDVPGQPRNTAHCPPEDQHDKQRA
jgi:thiosulfate reductase cytochrome b subunit